MANKRWNLHFWIAAIGVLCLGGQLGAQDSPKSDPIDESFVFPNEADYDRTNRDQRQEYSRKLSEVKRARSDSERLAKDLVKGNVDLGANRAEVTKYFNGLLFPEMTQTDDESLFELGNRRQTALDLVRSASNGSATKDFLLNDIFMPYATRVASDEAYHPAVRLNAVLIIGQLNRRDGVRNVEAPTPLDAAVRFLMQIVGDSKTPDYLKIGALSGLLRTATLDGPAGNAVDDPTRQGIIDLAIAILQKPDANSDAEYWMKRQATQILGGFRVPGSGGRVATILKKLVEDPNTPRWLAADAIQAYGSIRFENNEQADTAKVVKAIGDRVVHWMHEDADVLDNYITRIKTNRLLAERSTAETKKPGDNSDQGDESFGASGTGSKGPGSAKAAPASASTASATGAVDVPNYVINDVRQRSKTLCYIARVALDGEAPRRRGTPKAPENLKLYSDDSTRKTIDQLVSVLEQYMDDSNLNQTTNTTAELFTDKKSSSLDRRLHSALVDRASELERILGLLEPAAPAAPSTPADPTPSAG